MVENTTPDPAGPTGQLRILATSDVHMHLTDWDARRDRHIDGRGYDRIASRIARCRREAAGAVVLLDNGDMLQGAPEGDVCAEPNNRAPHIWAQIIDAMQYDAVGLGNHDFDFGLDVLRRFASDTEVPVLCSSVDEGAIDNVSPHAVLTKAVKFNDGVTRTIRIGVFSVLPPQTLRWNHAHLYNLVSFRTAVSAARTAVQALQDTDAQVIVGLCHSGFADAPDAADENFASAVALDVPGIDALVLGHTHMRFPGDRAPNDAGADQEHGTVHGVPAVMPGHAAERVGLIDLTLQLDAEGSVAAKRSTVALLPGAEPLSTITMLAAPTLALTRSALDAPLGQSDTGFHSYFAPLQHGPAETLCAAAMMDTIDRARAGTDLADLPLLAAVAPSMAGGRSGPGHYLNVPTGTVRERHVMALSPYQNSVWAAVLTGRDLWCWAERGASYFAQLGPQSGPLVDPAMPTFNFDMLHGLNAVIDPTQPALFDAAGSPTPSDHRRVRQLTRDGVPIDPQKPFLVAMTSFRGAGGGAFPGLGAETQILQTDVDMRDALRSSLAQMDGTISPHQPAWRFASDLGLDTWIDTAPEAVDHLNDIASFAPRVGDMTEEGFLRIHVTL